MSEEKDYYAVLQVSHKATAEELDRAYDRLSELYAPGQSKKRHAAERSAQIEDAYQTLSDDAQRAAYDRSLSSGLSVPGFGGGETVVTKFLSSRYGLPTMAGLVAAFSVAAVVVSLLSGGGDEGSATPTPTSGAVSNEGLPVVVGTEVTTESGLTYIEVTPGTGASPVLGDRVSVHYTGWLEEDGTKFDSSVDRGVPTEFGLDGVIEGWTEGLQLMKEGGKTRLIIPGDLAYGSAGRSNIPPDATLVFDIELLAVNPTPAPTATTDATASPTGSPEPSTSADPTSTPEPDSEEDATE